MIKKILSWPLLLVVLFSVFVANYAPGTWLVGWDNLMPELNMGMNLKRSLTAVWQSYQGLGLVGGMGHAADLIRQLILFPFTLVLPGSWIRYLWHFGMLALGTGGIYWGLGRLKKFKQIEKALGALFYLLNFGTIQYFWAPYEAFSTFWGFFPWLIFSFWQMLKSPTRKNWRLFFLINLLAIPSFYVQTLFLVYLLCLGCLLFSFVLQTKKISFRPFLVVLVLNLFWLLPFFYFLITNLNHPQMGMINQMSSQETFLRNQKRGTLSDFFLLRGYYYDFPDKESWLMQPWREHLSQSWVLVAGYALAVTVIFGLVKVFKKQGSFGWGIIGIFGLSAVALLSATPPFSWLNYLFRQLPILAQAFRAPLTKFIVPAAFSFSVLFAFGLKTAARLLRKTTYVLTFVLLVAFAWPVFRGNLINPQMRVEIPEEYFQLIEFFKRQPQNGRIANLPQGNFWGWKFYRWPTSGAGKSLRGSGFLWYGIEQPILDRAFDVWNFKNEQYYWELNYALQKKDDYLLANVFKKYFVEFIIFDDHIFFPGEKEYARLALDTKELLGSSEFFEKAAAFGDVEIFQLKGDYSWITKNLFSVAPFGFTQKDIAYHEFGIYLIDSQNPDVYYPFAELFTNRFQNEVDFEIKESENGWLIDRQLPEFLDNQYQLRGILPIFVLKEKEVILQDFPLSAKSCRDLPNGRYDLQILKESGQEFVRLSSQDDSACFEHYFGDLPLGQGWLVEVKYRYQQGYPLLAAGFDGWAKYKFFFTKLETNKDWQKAYFVIPAYQAMDYGLVIRLDNVSFNQQETVNDVASIKVIPLPWDELKAIRFEKKTKENLGRYYLVLPQSFEKGWLAVVWEGGRPKLLKHIMINNWANGWELEYEGQKPWVFFWPQGLEYLGFLLLIIWSSRLLKPRRWWSKGRDLTSSQFDNSGKQASSSPKVL